MKTRSRFQWWKPTALGASTILAASLLAGCGSGQDGTVGSTDGDVIIGAYGPLSGPASSLSVLYDAMEAYFADVNAKGGIDGHRIKFVVRDDQLNPAKTPSAVRQLVEQDNSTLMCGPAGSPTTMAVKGYLEARDIGIVPGAGSPELIGRTSYLPFPTYSPLAAQLAKHAVQDLDARRIAIAYTDDSVGRPTLAGATWQLKQLGVKPVATVPFNGTAPDQSALTAKLKAADADFVIVNNTAPVISQVFKSAAKIGYRPTWGAFWPALNAELLELSGPALDDGDIVFSSPFVLGDSADAKRFQQVMAKHKPDVDVSDTIAMLGWNSATVCAELVAKAVAAAGGKVPSSKQIVDAMPGLEIDDGYVNGLSWSDDDHTGQRTAMIVGLRDGKFVAETDFAELPDTPEAQ